MEPQSLAVPTSATTTANTNLPKEDPLNRNSYGRVPFDNHLNLVKTPKVPVNTEAHKTQKSKLNKANLKAFDKLTRATKNNLRVYQEDQNEGQKIKKSKKKNQILSLEEFMDDFQQ